MDRVDLVMREFLYVSKPAAREAEWFDVNACVRDGVDLLGPRFEAASIRLESLLSPEPLEMRGYSVALKRALINVLTNAKQVSSAGRSVRVTTRREGAFAIVMVEDEGPGVRPGEVSRLFEMFVSGRPDGIGLGLYLAKAAVENCNGTISAENRKEGGARFIIRLPLGASRA
jgi:signal transduction histidine kinase